MLIRRFLRVAATLALAGCASTTTPGPFAGTPGSPANPGQPQATDAPTRAASTAVPAPATRAAPTPTAAPIAARVNGQEIPRERFLAELARYVQADPAKPDPNSAAGKQLAAQLSSISLDALIERVLIEQEAKRLSVSVPDKDVDEEIRALVQLRGSRDKFDAWLKASRMTEEDARDMARADLLLATLRDRIVAQMPRTAEYIRAYHIVLATRTEAERILAQAQRGGNFMALAQANSIDASTRPAGGDLGWFARGTGAVIWQEIEDAAFGLNTNQISGVVASPIGFHIIKVTERQTRALAPEDQSRLQQTAMTQWLARLKTGATIERFN